MGLDNNHKNVYSIGDTLKHMNLLEYTHIKVYHASRTQNIESYLKEGIHTFTKSEVYQLARDTLIKCGIDEKQIVKCFEKNWREQIHHFNRVCVNISKEELLQDSGHYLVYGSEFICSMAAELGCQNKLKNIGIPTIFECDVDIKKFTSETINMIECDNFATGIWDGGIYIQGEIEPNEIVRYFNPPKIFDPIEYRNYFYSSTT